MYKCSCPSVINPITSNGNLSKYSNVNYLIYSCVSLIKVPIFAATDLTVKGLSVCSVKIMLTNLEIHPVFLNRQHNLDLEMIK